VVEGRLVRAPAMFTADAESAERSLHRLLATGGVRMLCSHGEEVADPFGELAALLAD
jgi:hypothetical protein